MLAERLLERPVFMRELLPQDLKIELDKLNHREAMESAHFLATVVGKAHARQMDAETRHAWQAELKRNRSKKLDAPSWLWNNVVELIVLNRDFPRSILYSISRLQLHFERLKSERNKEAYQKIDFMIGKIHSKVRYSTVDSILEQGLHAYLIGIKEDLSEVGNALNQHYFAYS